jgi:DNA-binding NtrC family response regulator
MSIDKPLILIIDDEQAIVQNLKEILSEENFSVETLTDGANAIKTIGILVPDLVILDIFMPHCNGLEILKNIKREFPEQKVIIISGYGNISIAIEAIKNGACDFIEKPFSLEDILKKLEFLKNKKNFGALEKIQDTSIEEELGLVGQSYQSLELYRYARHISQFIYPVLIEGPAGVGKSLLAIYIHKYSKLNKSNFIIFNKYSLPSDFCELYNNKQATIFLKNIHEFTKEQQEIIFKFLLNKENSRNTDQLAGLFYMTYSNINNKEQKIRIIASSKVSLYKCVCENKFSRQLYLKLSVTPIEIISINKRRYDIPLLVNYFLEQENNIYHKNIKFSSCAIRFFRNYNWERNISQIQEIIEKIVTFTQDLHAIIYREDLLQLFLKPIVKYNITGKNITEILEKNYLNYILKKHSYDLNYVSALLDINISQLQDKLSYHHINI